MSSKWLIAAIVLLALAIGAFFYKKYRVAPSIELQQLQLTDLDGKTVQLTSFSGKKLFIAFFATWCGPCISEIPELEKAKEELGKEGMEFILISDESSERLQLFREQTFTTLTILHCQTKLKGINVVTVPTAYVVNSHQQIVFKQVGFTKWSSNEMLQKLKEVSN